MPIGCYWHGHQCDYARWKITQFDDQDGAKADWKRRFEWTQVRRRELEKQHVHVEEVWECERLRMSHERLRWYQNARVQIEDSGMCPRTPTAEDIVQAVRDIGAQELMNYEIFGIVECDLQVSPAFCSRFTYVHAISYSVLIIIILILAT